MVTRDSSSSHGIKGTRLLRMAASSNGMFLDSRFDSRLDHPKLEIKVMDFYKNKAPPLIETGLYFYMDFPSYRTLLFTLGPQPSDRVPRVNPH
jgi:hypothetical protein